MQLFDFDAHHRETAAIWRLVRNLPFRFGLAKGRVVRWWAINVALNLLSESRFYGDIDLMVCSLSTPREPPNIFYKTWEVKLILLNKDGRPRSLKRTKTERILNQLKIHRKFGSPDVSLLELYHHETGTKTLKFFPTTEVFDVLKRRAKQLGNELFGYQILPFTYGRNEQGEDFGIFTLENPFTTPREVTFEIVKPLRTGAREPFLSLAHHLSVFAESESKRLSKPLGFTVVAYCRTCKKLCLIGRRDEVRCYHCFESLAGKSSIPPLHHLQLSKYLK
jgi:hypothetical protein